MVVGIICNYANSPNHWLLKQTLQLLTRTGMLILTVKSSWETWQPEECHHPLCSIQWQHVKLSYVWFWVLIFLNHLCAIQHGIFQQREYILLVDSKQFSMAADDMVTILSAWYTIKNHFRIIRTTRTQVVANCSLNSCRSSVVLKPL